MKARRWALFIVVNIVVSVLTTLAVLNFEGELERIVIVTVTPMASVSQPDVTAIPAEQVGVSAAGAATPTTSPNLEYTVQPGDTLGAIALVLDVDLDDLLLSNNLTEDSIIRPGDVLIIPQGIVVTPTPITPSATPAPSTPASPTPFPTETPTPPGPVEVRIQEVLSPGELGREGVVIINRGRTVNLQNWTLSAAGSNATFVFPRLTLAQEVPVTVYTIAGDDSPQALHWGQGAAQWNKSGTIIELRDAEGDLIAAYSVP